MGIFTDLRRLGIDSQGNSTIFVDLETIFDDFREFCAAYGLTGWRCSYDCPLAVKATSDAQTEDGEIIFPPTVTVVHSPSVDGG